MENVPSTAHAKNLSESESHSVISDSCDPMDCSPPDSSIHKILQARILEWVAIPSCRGLPNPGFEPRSPELQADSLPSEFISNNHINAFLQQKRSLSCKGNTLWLLSFHHIECKKDVYSRVTIVKQ